MAQIIKLQGVIYAYPEAAGMADINTKPASYTLTLGRIDADQPIVITATTEKEDVHVPGLGWGVRVDRVPIKHDRAIQFTLAEMNRRTWEVALDCIIAGESGDQNFVPGEDLEHRMWLKFEGYDRTNGQKFLLEEFGDLEQTGGLNLTGKVVRPQLTLQVLHSTVAAGTVKSLG